jgi:hypothetical protein
MNFSVEPSPPPPRVEVRRGICFRPDKPCFKLDAPKNAPSLKTTNPVKLHYHIQRMKAAVKTSRDPDMFMSIDEIKTGVKKSDRVKATLFLYLVGVLLIFCTIKGDL